MTSLLDRIGGGWPQPEVETCDWCDAETPTAQDQYMRNIGTTTYWLCGKCYRKSLAATGGQATLEGWDAIGNEAPGAIELSWLNNTAQKCKPLSTEGNTGSQSEGV